MNFNGEIFLNNNPIYSGPLIIDGDLTVAGLLYLSDGKDSAPSLTFSDDKTLGIERSASGEISIVSGGTKKLRISGTQVEVYQDLLVDGKTFIPDGSVGAPSLSFASDNGLGLYKTNTHQVGFASFGTTPFYCDFNTVYLNAPSALLGVGTQLLGAAGSGVTLPSGSFTSASATTLTATTATFTTASASTLVSTSSTTTDLTSSNTISIADGSTFGPSLRFSSEHGLGLARIANHQIGFISNTAAPFYCDNTTNYLAAPTTQLATGAQLLGQTGSSVTVPLATFTSASASTLVSTNATVSSMTLGALSSGTATGITATVVGQSTAFASPGFAVQASSSSNNVGIQVSRSGGDNLTMGIVRSAGYDGASGNWPCIFNFSNAHGIIITRGDAAGGPLNEDWKIGTGGDMILQVVHELAGSQTSLQTITTGSGQAAYLDTTSRNTGFSFTPSTTASTITTPTIANSSPAGGWYTITGDVSWSNNGIGFRRVEVMVNSVQQYINEVDTRAVGITYQSFECQVRAGNAQSVQIILTQNSGSSIALNGFRCQIKMGY